MKHLPVPTRSNVLGAPAAPSPLLVHGGPPPLSLSPHLKISKYCPHQSLVFSWQQGKWGRRGWLGSRIIIQIPRSKKKSGGWQEIMASLCGGRRQRGRGRGACWHLGLQLFSKRRMVCVVAAYRGVLPVSRRKEKPPPRLDLCTLDSQPLSLLCSLAPGSCFSCDLVWVAHMNHVAPRVQSRVLGMTHSTSPLPPASLPALVLTPSTTQSGYRQ